MARHCGRQEDADEGKGWMMPTEPSPQTLLFAVEPQRQDSLPYPTVCRISPSSRATDPSSSDRAAERLRRSGVGGQQRLQVYHALRAHQGVTSAELSRIMECDRYLPSRRLPELARAGWVCRGARRKCSVSGIVCETWWITRPWAEGHKSGAPVPSRAGQQTMPAPVVGEAGPILTPEEKHRLRDRFLTEGSPEARRFLASLRESEGG